MVVLPRVDKERCKSHSKHIYIRATKSRPHQRITSTHDSLLLLSPSFFFFSLLLLHQHHYLRLFIMLSFAPVRLIIHHKSFGGIVRLMRNIYNVISLHTFADVNRRRYENLLNIFAQYLCVYCWQKALRHGFTVYLCVWVFCEKMRNAIESVWREVGDVAAVATQKGSMIDACILWQMQMNAMERLWKAQ